MPLCVLVLSGLISCGANSKATVATPIETASAPTAVPLIKPAFHRWAVICAKDAQQAGLGDLVTAELSKATDIELVERDQLDAATKELQLAAALESKSVATRVKMGRLVKADALLILSIREGNKGRVLQIVVSESLCGARLRVDYLPYDQTAIAELSRRCARIVADVREHFAGGIRQIVGVSPFLSKDLDQYHEHFQATFAKLLESGLMARPQVAVIEIEEARAIGSETAIAGATIQDRPTPLLIEGEYSVKRGADRKCDIQFELTCQSAGGQRRTVRPPSQPLATIARFLTNDLPSMVLPGDDTRPGGSVSLEEQSRWLTARGQAFAQAGSWQEAMELLEAAVLLTPDDVSLRVKLLGLYGHFLQSRRDWLSGRPEPFVRQHMPMMIDAYLVYLEHLDYLIRNRRLNGIQAIAAFRGTTPFCFWPNYRTSPNSHGNSLEFHDLFQPVVEAEERFVVDVYPRVLELRVGREKEDPEFAAIFYEWRPGRDNDLREQWLHGLVEWFVKEKASSREITAHDLDFLYRLFAEVVPDHCPTPRNLVQFLDNHYFLRDRFLPRAADGITDDDWVAFLHRLADSKRRTASLYGRYGLLRRDFDAHLAHVKVRAPAESLLPKLDAWLKDFTADAGDKLAPDRMHSDCLYRDVDSMRRQIAFELNPPPEIVAQRSRQPASPARKFPSGDSVSAITPVVAKLKFEEIPMWGVKCDGFDHYTTCGDDGDVAWQDHAVVLIPHTGPAREFPAPQAYVKNVCWDGKQIWVATLSHGIAVQTFDGKIVAKIGPDQGLPPADRGIVLRALAAGKVCAAGSFGEHSRAWCAMIELSQGGAKVNVFHQATHVEQTWNPRDDHDPQRAFVPSSFHEFDPGNGRPHLLMLDRNIGSALAINPATLEVSLLSDYVRFLGYEDLHTNSKGEILGIRVGTGRVAQLTQTGTVFDERKNVRPLSIEVPNRGFRLVGDRGRLLGGVRAGGAKDTSIEVEGLMLLEYRGALYVPGRTGAIWFRIDPETFRPAAIDPGSHHPGQFCWYAVSNRYGLVGGRPDVAGLAARFFRVIVEESAKDGPAPVQGN